MSVVQGAVSILGAKVKPSTAIHPLRVCAPLSHSLPVITALTPTKGNKTNTVILVENHSPGIERISEICPFAEPFFQLPLPSVAISCDNPTFHILFESSISISQIRYPVSWNEAYTAIRKVSSPKVIICGPKGVGKSTFCQYLINSSVRHHSVTYLETDPGQPAFTPPGLIALHSLSQPILSPSFARCNVPGLIRSQHIGNVSPRDNPQHYIKCITDLLSHDPRDAPTIINTPGWTKGTGFELLTSLIEFAKPDFVVVLSQGRESLAESLRPFTAQSNLLVIESANAIPPTMPITAAELRTLSLMSYFHGTNENKWDFETHLTGWKPWTVSYTGDSHERGIWAVAIQGQNLALDDTVLGINGTIVAIILVSKTMEADLEFTKEGIAVLSGRETQFIEPELARCVGYGLIRGIDVKNGHMFILSPWDPFILTEDEKVILERGHISLPIWGMWDHRTPKILGPWLQKQ